MRRASRAADPRDAYCYRGCGRRARHEELRSITPAGDEVVELVCGWHRLLARLARLARR